jgi:hypothetical protein
MAHKIEPGAAWGKWQEWARLFVSEINRLNEEVENVRNAAIARIGEVYERIEQRHDSSRVLIQESETRLRTEIQRVETAIANAVDDNDVGADIKEFRAALTQTGLDIMELKTKCAMWGILAGSVPALAVVMFELLKK